MGGCQKLELVFFVHTILETEQYIILHLAFFVVFLFPCYMCCWLCREVQTLIPAGVLARVSFCTRHGRYAIHVTQFSPYNSSSAAQR